ncbi:carbohydrate kinase family protein [Cellulomonas composti]|uniref:Sugar kinase n=1 Tax=Cellulomonas composti TaxID=266130 RepID=A0A511J9P4_9CELL|nr:PfkB family carbohydrate kinase [Cellulomonas composti]GEL94717.1 sugar kinase [Cellulomonas composti]
MPAPEYVLVNGAASWNTVVRVAALPEPRAQTLFAGGHTDGLGGTSAGKAVTLTALGVPTVLVTTTADDERGAAVRTALVRPGLRLVDRRAVAGGTERHVNLVSDDGSRVSVYLDLPTAPPADDEVRGLVAGARVAVLDLAESSRELLSVAREAGVPVWCDVHDDDGVADYPRAFAAAADVLVVSGARLADPEAYLRAAVGRGCGLAVCTLGADGALALDGDGWWHVAPAAVTALADAEGAGDAFVAGLLRATLDGLPRERALAEASAAGALAVSQPGLGAPHASVPALRALADTVTVTRG